MSTLLAENGPYVDDQTSEFRERYLWLRGLARPYQLADCDKSIELWQNGVKGCLTRAATGTGKTMMACLKSLWWLSLSPMHRVYIVCTEVQHAYQWQEEFHNWTAIDIGIEMASNHVDAKNLPFAFVAMRQSWLNHTLHSNEQKQFFAQFDIMDLGLLTFRKSRKLINYIRRGADIEAIKDCIRRHNASSMANHEIGTFNRVNRIDPLKYTWLGIFDECHRAPYKLKSVKPIVDHFDKNLENRRCGVTATPRRADCTSLGHVMFPGCSLDLPLYSRTMLSAISDGWLVPFKQVYVAVEGVDFAEIPWKGKDYDQSKVDELINTEEQRARLGDPVLELAGERLTLVFCCSVAMAQEMAAFFNARSKLLCECGMAQWHPSKLIGDGAKCKACGKLLGGEHVVSYGRVAESVDGSVPHGERQRLYTSHKNGEFQFLCVCNLCREGYNVREISCIAILRPVSKAASYLAEQMRGRGARPLGGVLDGIETAEQRRDAIASSSKPDCLIIDLVGTSGLPDCASTLDIYADGLPDEVIEAAQDELLANNGMGIEEAIEIAVAKVETANRKKKEERDARIADQRKMAEERARLGMTVRYTATEIENGEHVRTQRLYRGEVRMATDKQLRYLYKLGFRDIDHYDRPSLRQAGRMIEQLQKGKSVDDVRFTNKLVQKAEAYLKRIAATGSRDELQNIGLEIKGERGIDSHELEALRGAWKSRQAELTF